MEWEGGEWREWRLFFLGGRAAHQRREREKKAASELHNNTTQKNEWATGDNKNKKFTEGVTRGRCDCKLSAKLGKNQLLG